MADHTLDTTVTSLHSGAKFDASNIDPNQSSAVNVNESSHHDNNTILNSHDNPFSSSFSSDHSSSSSSVDHHHTLSSTAANHDHNNTDSKPIDPHTTSLSSIPHDSTTTELSSSFSSMPTAEPVPSSSSSSSSSTATDALVGDPIERVRAIAASLGISVANKTPSSSSSSSSSGSVLGKRRADDMNSKEDSANESKKRKKVFVPAQVGTNKDINFIGLLIGPKGSHQRSIETESGCRLYIRGKGSSRDGNGENTEDLHVVVVGDTDEQVTKGEEMVERLYKDPVYASEVKQKQLQALAADKAGHDDHGRGSSRGERGDRGRGHHDYDHHHSRDYPSHGGSSSGRYRPPSSQIRNNPDGTISEIFVIPNATAGSIIGKGGETIKDIQQRYGARVQMQPASELKRGQVDREIAISGTPSNVGEAKRFVLYLVDKELDKNPSGLSGSSSYGGTSFGSSSSSSSGHPPPYHGGGHPSLPPSSSNPPGGPTLRVPIPDDKAGTVIGKNGTTIKSIQQRTGVHIQIPKEGDPADPRYRTLTITAPTREQCEHAQHLVYEVLATADSNRTGGGGGGGYIPGGGVPPMMMPGGGIGGGLRIPIQDYEAGALIGRNGTTIRELQDKTQCRIIIPPKADPGTNPPIRTIEIAGPPDKMEYARQEIYRVLATYQNRGPPTNMGGIPPTAPTNMYGQPTPGGIPGYPGVQLPPQTQPTVIPGYGGYGVMPPTTTTATTAPYGQPTYGVPTPTTATTAVTPGTVPPGSDAAAIAAWQAYHAQYAAWQQQYGSVAAAQQQQQQVQQQPPQQHPGYPGVQTGYSHY